MLQSPWAQFQSSLTNSAQAKRTEDLRELSQCDPSAVPGVTGAPTAHNDTRITPNSSPSIPGVFECPSQASFLAQCLLWILITPKAN